MRKLFYALPPKWRFWARRAYYFPHDAISTMLGSRHKFEPPKGSIYIGSGDFMKQGAHQLTLLKEYLQLQPDDRVLDIGSGIGRTATALTTYLSDKGRYEGFDVIKSGVDWCNEKIKKDFPNFNFSFVPLNNDLYNNGGEAASAFTFPYEDNHFDAAFLFSVFTHMQPGEIERYLEEIARVLNRNGKCLATFFTYNDDNELSISAQAGFKFPFKGDGCRWMDENVKSANVALHVDNLKDMITKAGLEMTSYHPGYWNHEISQAQGLDFQDIVVLSKI